MTVVNSVNIIKLTCKIFNNNFLKYFSLLHFNVATHSKKSHVYDSPKFHADGLYQRKISTISTNRHFSERTYTAYYRQKRMYSAGHIFKKFNFSKIVLKHSLIFLLVHSTVTIGLSIYLFTVIKSGYLAKCEEYEYLRPIYEKYLKEPSKFGVITYILLILKLTSPLRIAFSGILTLFVSKFIKNHPIKLVKMKQFKNVDDDTLGNMSCNSKKNSDHKKN